MNTSIKTNQIPMNDYIINSINDAVIVTDLDGKIICWNKASEDLYKWKSEEVIDKNIANITPSKTSKTQAEEIMLALKKGEVWEGEFEVQNKNGSIFPVHVLNSPLKDENGNLIGITGCSRIIPKQFKYWELARENEEKYKSLYENSPIPYHSLNEDGAFIDVNPAWLSMLGYEKKEVLEKYYRDFLHPDWQSHFDKNFPAFKKRGYVKDVEFKIRHKNGYYLDISLDGGIGYHPNGTFKQTFCVFQDITAKKQAESKAEENEKKFKNITENIPGMFYRAKSDWSVNTITNSNLITEYTNNQFLSGKVKWLDIIHPDDKARVMLEGEIFKKIETNLVQEYRIITKEKSVRNIADYKRSVFKNGELAYIDGVLLDKTKQHDYEQRLKQSDRVFNLSLDMFCIAGFDGYFKYLNPAWERVLGWSIEELQSKPWLEFVHPDDRKKIENIESVIVDGKEIYQFENRYICKDGSERWLSWNAQPFPNESIMIGAVRDVSESKEIEKELIKAKEKAEENEKELLLAKKIVEKNTEMILSSQSAAHICSYSTNLIENDIEKSAWECSPEFYKIFGIDETYPHTIEGWANFIHPDHREKMFAYHESVVKNRSSFNHEYKIIRINDGAERWVKGTGELVYDEQGEPIRMHGAIQDITESKQIEDELIKAKEKAEESELQVAATLNAIPDLVFKMDEAGVVIDYKADLKDLYYQKDSIIGKNCSDLLPPNAADIIVSHLKLAFETGLIQTFEYYLEIPSIGKREYEARMLKSGTNETTTIIRDITERKKNEIELISAKEKAEESDRLKSAFLTNMSHEIRTPMNGILGFTNLLKEPGLTGEDQRKFIGIIEKSGDRMLNTVNDIIDISKVEAGLVDVTISDINLNKQLDELFDFFLPEANKKHIKLSVTNKLPDKQATIKSDKEKLDSVLTNFIKNAIKYTHAGSIEFGVSTSSTTKNKTGTEPVELEFYVKDTGIGIAKERQKAVFNRFEQADIEDQQAYEGSGLGLAITKAYVEMLGGKIWVESEEGVGSHFYFTLPFVTNKKEIPEKNTADSNKPQSVKKGLKILIAEDDEFAITFLSIVLNDYAKEMLIAKTGIEAVEMCRENPDLDIVLMDIKIPGIDGYEATRQIREFNKGVFIVAQTAYAQSGDREKAIDAGCDNYISKPIDKEKLTSIINEYI